MGSKGEGRVKDKIYTPSLCHQENESTIHCHSGREIGFIELGQVHFETCGIKIVSICGITNKICAVGRRAC